MTYIYALLPFAVVATALGTYFIANTRTARTRRRCFHHDHRSGKSWITNHIVDWRKWYQCSACGKGWLI